MSKKKKTHWAYTCEIGRLDCWSTRESSYYDTEEEAEKNGWTEKDGKIRCPMCSYREDKRSSPT